MQLGFWELLQTKNQLDQLEEDYLTPLQSIAKIGWSRLIIVYGIVRVIYHRVVVFTLHCMHLEWISLAFVLIC